MLLHVEELKPGDGTPNYFSSLKNCNFTLQTNKCSENLPAKSINVKEQNQATEF